MAEEIRMPKLGATMETGTIGTWLKKEGDRVEAGEPLLEVVTDKITIEVEAAASGILLKTYYGPGDVVPVQAIIGYIGEPGEAVPDLPGDAVPGSPGEAISGSPGALPPAGDEIPQAGEGKIRATPAARATARRLGIDLASVRGTGPKGRIQKEDVEAAYQHLQGQVKATPLARKIAGQENIRLADVQGSGIRGKITRGDVEAAIAAKREAAESGESRVLTRKVEGMRKIIAERMSQSAFTAPHVTLVTEIDMSAAVELRNRLLPGIEKKTGRRLSYTEIILKAAALALKRHPAVNASLKDDHIVYHDRVHIGMAVAVPDGLVVPVVRDADRKGLAELTAECKDLARLARENRLTPDLISGGTFTVSNLGMYAVDAFTPIINPPEAAILGVGRIREKPVGIGGSIALRPMMTASLSFDHRVMDGAPAAAFLTELKELLEQPYQMLL